MSEKDASLLSDDELAAIEDMVASGRLDSDIFNANVDAETFAMLYKLRMDNPGNFGTPRLVNLGAKLNF